MANLHKTGRKLPWLWRGGGLLSDWLWWVMGDFLSKKKCDRSIQTLVLLHCHKF